MIITVMSKQYVIEDSAPVERNYPNRIATCVAYWSIRNGQPFGPTRIAWSDAKPGSVSRAIAEAAIAAFA